MSSVTSSVVNQNPTSVAPSLVSDTYDAPWINDVSRHLRVPWTLVGVEVNFDPNFSVPPGVLLVDVCKKTRHV